MINIHLKRLCYVFACPRRQIHRLLPGYYLATNWTNETVQLATQACNCEFEYSYPLATIDEEEPCKDQSSLMRTAELTDDDVHKCSWECRHSPPAAYAPLLMSALACRRYHKGVRRMCPASHYRQLPAGKKNQTAGLKSKYSRDKKQ